MGLDTTRRSLVCQSKAYALAQPFRIARGVKDEAHVVFVEITADGLRGRGEGVPYLRYGESLKGVIEAIEAVRSLIESGLTRNELTQLMPPGAARNAIDCALWDFELRRSDLGELLPTYLTLKREITAQTIVLDTPQLMGLDAKAKATAPLLKVKLGVADARECILEVRNAAPDTRLIVDPNESWDMQLLTKTLPTLIYCGVELIEQPLPAGLDEGLRQLHSEIMICADESAHSIEDLEDLSNKYGAINVKLDKCGGLTSALDLIAAAREGGFMIMVGCMVCSSLSVAPALRIAAQADWVDLDGPLWLKADYADGVQLSDGYLIPPRPGFWGGG